MAPCSVPSPQHRLQDRHTPSFRWERFRPCEPPKVRDPAHYKEAPVRWGTSVSISPSSKSSARHLSTTDNPVFQIQRHLVGDNINTAPASNDIQIAGVDFEVVGKFPPLERIVNEGPRKLRRLNCTRRYVGKVLTVSISDITWV